MTERPLRVAFVGCGNIAGPYARTLQAHKDSIEIVGATDLLPERAQEFVKQWGGKHYPALADVLAAPEVDIVLNLTIHHAHPEVITQCILAGKPVHSEKPIAMTYAEAKQLVDLAAAKGVRLGSSPFTYMGEAQQTAWKLVRAGKLGTVRVAYAEVNWGRIESWHPNPVPFYQVGPHFDVAVYPLTLLTTYFGPAKRVTAFSRTLKPDRTTKDGTPFRLTTPDFHVAGVEWASGLLLRLTANFYVRPSVQTGVELHGDDGSLYMTRFDSFDAKVQFAPFGGQYDEVPPVKEPFSPGVEWGRCLVEMADAIRHNRPHRAQGAQAAHVIEILGAMDQSGREGRTVELTSTFTPPAPMEWAL